MSFLSVENNQYTNRERLKVLAFLYDEKCPAPAICVILYQLDRSKHQDRQSGSCS
jgi:hypothetical protein